MRTSEPRPLRAIFDEAAELYDRARPGYPAALYDDLATLAGIGPGCRVLEIGAGTGKATLPLAERGCEVVAVELGAALAAVARRNLARFPAVQVVTATFEEWPLPPEPFDLVLVATAYHWLDPATRLTRAADALRPPDALKPGGALAIVDTHHVAGGTEPFFVEVQDCYERWDPATPPGLRLTPAESIPLDTTEIDGSGRFEAVQSRRYAWDLGYTTAEYIDVLLTYSGHRALEPAARAGLLGCIRQLIETRHGGRIVKRYLTELRLAHRRP